MGSRGRYATGAGVGRLGVGTVGAAAQSSGHVASVSPLPEGSQTKLPQQFAIATSSVPPPGKARVHGRIALPCTGAAATSCSPARSHQHMVPTEALRSLASRQDEVRHEPNHAHQGKDTHYRVSNTGYLICTVVSMHIPCTGTAELLFVKSMMLRV